MNAKPKSIDEYIRSFPKEVQKKLKELRSFIREEAPSASEAIKYSMPTYVLNGNLCYFAAYKKHIGFYPAPIRSEKLKPLIAPYLSSKSTLQFRLDEPLPATLILKVVKYLVKENIAKAKLKEKLKAK
jgi:uncharacterized protein YdhG (YjbR/CyaY superfamily)